MSYIFMFITHCHIFLISEKKNFFWFRRENAFKALKINSLKRKMDGKTLKHSGPWTPSVTHFSLIRDTHPLLIELEQLL